MQFIHFLSNFEQYLSSEKRYSKHTLIAYTNDLIQFNDYIENAFGKIELKDIKSIYVRSWFSLLKEEENTSKTINRKISTLKSYYKFLIKNNFVDSSPLVHITAPKIKKRLPQYVEQNDIKTLLHYKEFTNDFDGILHKTIIAIFYFTGMRLSELQNLKLNDIDLNNNSLKVLGKGNKERIIPITNDLKITVIEYLNQRTEIVSEFSNNFLLLNKKGKPLYAKIIYTIVKKYLSEVTTISKKSPHILRHSFATHLTNNGAQLNAVKELLGHSSLAATQIYTHNSIQKLKDIHKKAHPKA